MEKLVLEANELYQDSPIATVFVTDLSEETTEAVLFDEFASAGSVLSVQVWRDMNSGRSKGRAYVNFRDVSSGTFTSYLHSRSC